MPEPTKSKATKLIGWRRKKVTRAPWQKVPDWNPIQDTDDDGKPISGAKGAAYQQCMNDMVKEPEAFEYSVLHENELPERHGQSYRHRMLRAGP